MNVSRQALLFAIPLLASAALVSGQTPRGTAALTGEYGNSWALLIGIDHTSGKATLSSVADARRMREALVKIGFPRDNIRILSDPKGSDIRRVILQPFEGMRANDRYVVYFSGHGETRPLLEDDEEGYLLAADYNSNDLLNTAISMKEIRQFGRQMPIKHVLFILDACNAGHAVEQSAGDVPTAPEALKPYLGKRVTEILAAGRADQNAYQINNQGIFTKWIVKTLEFFPASRPGGALTANRLWADVSDQVAKESNGRLTPPAPYRSGQGAFVLWFPPPVATGALPPPPSPVTVGIERDYGTLAIRGKLAGVEVWVDDHKVGETQAGGALVLANVATGTRRIRGVKAGRPDWVRDVDVVANQRIELLIETDNDAMVLVPAGVFTMGSHDHDDEKPSHRVHLDAYYIDTYEVTNALYKQFMQATSRPAPEYWWNGDFNGANHPVVGVTWHDADAYCEWAGKRLPTEAEWEKAARGTDRRDYPWGGQWDATRVNSFESTLRKTAAVGSHPGGMSLYGLHDMAGNVWEWVGDWYDKDYYPRSPQRNPKGPGSGKSRVMRGGSWKDLSVFLRAANRKDLDPEFWGDNVGFRCAKMVP